MCFTALAIPTEGCRKRGFNCTAEVRRTFREVRGGLPRGGPPVLTLHRLHRRLRLPLGFHPMVTCDVLLRGMGPTALLPGPHASGRPPVTPVQHNTSARRSAFPEGGGHPAVPKIKKNNKKWVHSQS